jgi:hypothetical protein
MLPAECPVCHQKPAHAGNTVYCPHCGWNRDSAISALRMSLNAVPFGIVMFGGMMAWMYWGFRFNRSPILMIFFAFPALGILWNYVYLKRKLATLQAMPATTSAHAAAAVSAFNSGPLEAPAPSTAPTFSPSARDEAILRTPVPRRVRMSNSGRIVMWISCFGLLLFVVPFAAGAYQQWTVHHSLAHVTGLGWGIALEVIVVLAAYGIWRGQARECDLLEHGQAVMGRVLNQFTDNKSNSTVQFEFTDFMGSSHRGSAMDRTNQLFSGMPLLVFYDRNDPKRLIAYCSTLHIVVLPK